MASVVVAVAGLLINVVFANDPMVPKISTYSVDDSLDWIKEKMLLLPSAKIGCISGMRIKKRLP